jgi:hypothetical protein
MEYVIHLRDAVEVESQTKGKEWVAQHLFDGNAPRICSPYFTHVFEEVKKLFHHDACYIDGRWVDDNSFRLWSTFPDTKFNEPLNPLTSWLARKNDFSTPVQYELKVPVDLKNAPTGWVHFDDLCPNDGTYLYLKNSEYVSADEVSALKDQPDLISLIQL